MHFEIIVEDESAKRALENLCPLIIHSQDGRHSARIHSYKGKGRIPKDIKRHSDANKRILLEQLPRLLAGFGRTFAAYEEPYEAAVIVVCDLDNENRQDFLNELEKLLDNCQHKPNTRFCLAIEESEAWLLGDIPAVKKAYPQAKDSVLQAYENDSICGTWEVLADAVYKGGAKNLKAKGWVATGTAKIKWALEE
jgi:hypothetical protein